MVDEKDIPPEEQVKRLAKLIEDQQKELETKKKELEEAKVEASEEKRKEEIEKLRREVQVPDLEGNINNNFGQATSLEETVKNEAPGSGNEDPSNVYQIAPDTATGQIYNSIMSIYQEAMQAGSVSPDMAQQMQNAQYALNKKEEDIQSGAYNPGDEIKAQANTIMNMAEKILGLYTAGTKRNRGAGGI